jgi:hypothetical protein
VKLRRIDLPAIERRLWAEHAFKADISTLDQQNCRPFCDSFDSLYLLNQRGMVVLRVEFHTDRLRRFCSKCFKHLGLAQEVSAALRELSDRYVIGILSLPKPTPSSLQAENTTRDPAVDQACALSDFLSISGSAVQLPKHWKPCDVPL